MSADNLRSRLKKGDPQLGMFVISSEPAVVEIAAIAGMDFVVLDLEHGSIYYDVVENMCRAADAAGIDLVVRVPLSEPNNVFRPLDSGAVGVQVPQVNDVATAIRIGTSTKYAPDGFRGGARPRSSRWGTRQDYFSEANKETITVIHCETKQCVDNIYTILAAPNIDVVFAGPQDLSHSYGVPGDTGNALVQNAIQVVLAAAKEKGVAAGTLVFSPDDAKMRIEQGFTYLVFTNDQNLLLKATQTLVQGVRG